MLLTREQEILIVSNCEEVFCLIVGILYTVGVQNVFVIKKRTTMPPMFSKMRDFLYYDVHFQQPAAGFT